MSIIGILEAAAIAEVLLAPATGGASLALFAMKAAPVAAATGLGIPVLIIICTVGILLISTLFDDYTHIEVGPGKIIFERKSHT